MAENNSTALKDLTLKVSAIASEIDQLGGVAELLADAISNESINGEGLDNERAAYHVARRIKALSEKIGDVYEQLFRQERANG